MYTIKENIKINIRYTDIANKTGLRLETITRILHGKQNTKYLTALSIAKCIDENAEINDYFVKI